MGRLTEAQYTEDKRYSCADPDTAALLFSKHHEFLIMSFLTRAQGVGWSNTPICQYFKRLYPVSSFLAPIHIECSLRQHPENL